VEESEASVRVARGRDFTDLRLCRLQAGRISGSRRLRYSVRLPNGIAVTSGSLHGDSPDRNARKVPSDCDGGHPKLATATFWQWPTVG